MLPSHFWNSRVSKPVIRSSRMAMLEWNSYRQQIKVRIGEITKLSPDTIKGYQALTAAGTSVGASSRCSR
jgi:hypothetical protein